MGTPIYLSPEQVALGKDPSKAAEIDEKVDIYALGLILLELSCNITTVHEKLSTFNLVKDKREFPNWAKLKDTIEGKLIIELTQTDPSKRPSALHIKH